MPMIQVKNLTFAYDGSYEPVFENASFTIDTDWKLGFIARNGRGKTTFLNLLMGKYPYQGQIIADEAFDYFPFDPPQALCMAQALETLCPGAQLWALEREASLMQVKPEALWQPFQTLSKGEQTKLLLAALFVREGRFLLIDEPTNHLDARGRRSVARYLKSKRGFILVSHDRDFLDEAVDHVLAINKKTIEVQKGNFSSWWENKTRRDQFEQAQNEKLAGQISQLTQAMRRTQQWSDKVEKTKYAKSADGDANRGFVDKGFIGAQSARMMKRAKAIETRIQSAIDEKSGLLADLEKPKRSSCIRFPICAARWSPFRICPSAMAPRRPAGRAACRSVPASASPCAARTAAANPAFCTPYWAICRRRPKRRGNACAPPGWSFPSPGRTRRIFAGCRAILPGTSNWMKPCFLPFCASSIFQGRSLNAIWPVSAPDKKRRCCWPPASAGARTCISGTNRSITSTCSPACRLNSSSTALPHPFVCRA
jgi:ATPase subunit of ABC transporter with duplicated ATPase domains